MNKTQQSAYHNIFQGFQNMADEILIPRLEPEELPPSPSVTAPLKREP